MQKFVISSKENGLELLKFVRSVLRNAPEGFIYKLFRKKDVKVNSHWQKADFLLKENDVVEIYATDEQFNDFRNHVDLVPDNKIETSIVYEDENILVINKEKGLLVQGDSSGDISLDVLVKQYLLFKKELNDIDSVGPVHRLDRNTSGLVLFGKNKRSLIELSNIINNKDLFEKHYLTLVKGLVPNEGIIEEKILKLNNGSAIISDGGKPAITKYRLIESFKRYSLVDALLLTGRTHQIRVHFAHIGYPVVGDRRYGDFEVNAIFKERFNLKSQYLHAYKIIFKKIDGPLSYLSNKTFEAKLPSILENIYVELKKDD